MWSSGLAMSPARMLALFCRIDFMSVSSGSSIVVPRSTASSSSSGSVLTASRQASPAAPSSSPWRSGGSLPPSAEAALQVSVLARHLVAVEVAVGVWADHDFPPFHASSRGADLELVLSRVLVNWESGTLVVGASGVPLASYATLPPSTPPSMACARAFDEPPPLLRVAADCARSRRDGRLGPPLTRVGEDDARHRRARVTRQRRIRTSGRCTGAGRSCGLRAD